MVPTAIFIPPLCHLPLPTAFLSFFASMASHQLFSALVFVSLLAGVELSACHVLEGSVTCLDCSRHHDLSEIKVLVKCSKVKKMAVATTKEDGSFKTELPSDSTTSTSSSSKCQAKIMGGPTQLYASKTAMISRTVKLPNSDSYTISAPLNFYTVNPQFGSSKTVDLPVPPEWGLPPTSYFTPFLPIIGIP
ncbi:hypothetical protein NMG60_11015568 [Bertholletia excelsa]